MGFADFPMPIMEPKILVFFTYYWDWLGIL
jgi:hypothetical protein